MLRYVMTIVVAAATVATFSPAVAMIGGDAGTEVPYATSGNESLDKTGTTRGQEKEAGSQVLVDSSLTSPISFHAEGTGLRKHGLISPAIYCRKGLFHKDFRRPGVRSANAKCDPYRTSIGHLIGHRTGLLAPGPNGRSGRG